MQKSIKSLKKFVYYNENMYTQIQNFERNFLENYNDSELAVKTKHAPFFMNFPNFNKNGQLFSHWTGPLS